MGSVGIIGYGSCLPAARISTSDIVAQINNAYPNGPENKRTSEEWLNTRTGVDYRARANLERESAPILATIAAERALRDAQTKVEDLDFIIAATNATDHILVPGIAPRVQYLLAKEEVTPLSAFDVGAGCSGGLFAAKIAQMCIRDATQEKEKTHNPRGLVIMVDTLSNVINQTDRNTAPLVGDGAAAVVFGTVEEGGIKQITALTDGTLGYHIAYTGYGNQGLSGFQMTGREVHKFVLRKAVPCIEEILQKSGFSLADLPHTIMIPHQMNARSIEAFSEKLEEATPHRLKRLYKQGIVNYANTSAASAFIGLDEEYRNSHIEKGDLIMIPVFGAGLTWGAILEVAHRDRPRISRTYDQKDQEKRVDQLNEKYNQWKSNFPEAVLKQR